MSRLRIVYIVSLIILGVLVVFTVFRPMASEQKYSKVSQESVIQGEDEWISQFDIINREGEDSNYIINWSTGGETYTERVSIKDGGIFTYIHHVYPETVKEGKVNLTIYKEGEGIPFEDCIYYIQFN